MSSKMKASRGKRLLFKGAASSSSPNLKEYENHPQSSLISKIALEQTRSGSRSDVSQSQNDLFNAREERETLLRIEELLSKERELQSKIAKCRKKEKLKRESTITPIKDGFKFKIFPNENNIFMYQKMNQLNLYSPYNDIFESTVDGWKCIAKTSKTKKEKQLFNNEKQILQKLPPHSAILRYFFTTACGIFAKTFSFYEWKYDNLRSLLQEIEKSDDNMLTIGAIAEIALEIAKGFQHLHEHNIILRDFNSTKVWVDIINDKICSPVIADFSVAVLTSDNNKPNDFVGTMGFIAPEVFATQQKRKEYYTKDIDVYSFGMFLYELMVLKAPYHNTTHNMRELRQALEESPEIPMERAVYYSPLVLLHLSCIDPIPPNRPRWPKIIDTLQSLVDNPKNYEIWGVEESKKAIIRLFQGVEYMENPFSGDTLTIIAATGPKGQNHDLPLITVINNESQNNNNNNNHNNILVKDASNSSTKNKKAMSRALKKSSNPLVPLRKQSEDRESSKNNNNKNNNKNNNNNNNNNNNTNTTSAVISTTPLTTSKSSSSLEMDRNNEIMKIVSPRLEQFYSLTDFAQFSVKTSLTDISLLDETIRTPPEGRRRRDPKRRSIGVISFQFNSLKQDEAKSPRKGKDSSKKHMDDFMIDFSSASPSSSPSSTSSPSLSTISSPKRRERVRKTSFKEKFKLSKGKSDDSNTGESEEDEKHLEGIETINLSDQGSSSMSIESSVIGHDLSQHSSSEMETKNFSEYTSSATNDNDNTNSSDYSMTESNVDTSKSQGSKKSGNSPKDCKSPKRKKRKNRTIDGSSCDPQLIQAELLSGSPRSELRKSRKQKKSGKERRKGSSCDMEVITHSNDEGDGEVSLSVNIDNSTSITDSSLEGRLGMNDENSNNDCKQQSPKLEDRKQRKKEKLKSRASSSSLASSPSDEHHHRHTKKTKKLKIRRKRKSGNEEEVVDVNSMQSSDSILKDADSEYSLAVLNSNDYDRIDDVDVIVNNLNLSESDTESGDQDDDGDDLSSNSEEDEYVMTPEICNNDNNDVNSIPIIMKKDEAVEDNQLLFSPQNVQVVSRTGSGLIFTTRRSIIDNVVVED